MKTLQWKQIGLGVLFAGIPLIILSPFVIGILESRTNQVLLGGGRCRIDNAAEVLSQKDKRPILVSGFVKVKATNKEIPHLWGADATTGRTIDVTCDAACEQSTICYRRPVQRFYPCQPWLPVISSDQKSLRDWAASLLNRAYLVAFLWDRNRLINHRN